LPQLFSKRFHVVKHGRREENVEEEGEGKCNNMIKDQQQDAEDGAHYQSVGYFISEMSHLTLFAFEYLLRIVNIKKEARRLLEI
jgi:hypothetical protein